MGSWCNYLCVIFCAFDIGEPTMTARTQTQSDGRGLSSDGLPTSPSSLEDGGKGEGFRGRVVRSTGMQLLICKIW